MRAGSSVGRSGGKRAWEWHQRCCRLEEFLVGEAGLPGWGQLRCATQAPGSPSPGLASLLPDHPLPNTGRGRTHLSNTESRGSHHTVPCTRIASGTTIGELRQFIHVRHSAIR